MRRKNRQSLWIQISINNLIMDPVTLEYNYEIIDLQLLVLANYNFIIYCNLYERLHTIVI